MAVDASITCSDALDFLRSFPPGSVDCIVTDQGCDISPRAVDLTRARINNFCRLQNSLFPEV